MSSKLDFWVQTRLKAYSIKYFDYMCKLYLITTCFINEKKRKNNQPSEKGKPLEVTQYPVHHNKRLFLVFNTRKAQTSFPKTL